jgi:uncharacterized glyoxalase superfamily protein PhnB
MRRIRNDNFAPPGWRTVTPRLFAKESRDLCAFLRSVFGAKGRYRANRPSELRIGDCILMVNEVSARPATSACLYVYVRDVERAFGRALRAKARTLEAPLLTSYGEYRCMFEDRWGNVWQVAERKS